MTRNQKRNVIILVALTVLLVIVEHYAPEPVNWNYSFSEKDKIPMGCWVLKKDLLPRLFNEQLITVNNGSLFQTLDSQSFQNKNLIIITSDFNPDPADLDQLLDFVSQGNQVFLAAFHFSKSLADTLKFTTKVNLPSIDSLMKSKVRLTLVNPLLKEPSGYKFSQNMPEHYFASLDTVNSIILGLDQNNHINFVKERFGKGKIYIHCQPTVFTNYHLLYSNYSYVSGILSYLPESSTVWDEYYKPFKRISTSPMRFVLSRKPLKTAYFLLIMLVIIYMLFEGKRRQRAMPLIKPLENTSLDFLRTLGKLYYRQQNHQDLAKKILIYFNDFIHNRYFINVDKITRDYFTVLSAKSGVNELLIEEIYNIAGKIQSKNKEPGSQIIKLYQKIHEFKNKCL